MDSQNLLLSQPFPILGAIAFVLTALQVTVSFVMFFRILYTPVPGTIRIVLLYFIMSLTMQMAWLLYLRCTNDPFIIIALGLEILCSLVFLFQIIWTLFKNKNRSMPKIR
jgi:hypothetical protein